MTTLFFDIIMAGWLFVSNWPFCLQSANGTFLKKTNEVRWYDEFHILFY